MESCPYPLILGLALWVALAQGGCRWTWWEQRFAGRFCYHCGWEEPWVAVAFSGWALEWEHRAEPPQQTGSWANPTQMPEGKLNASSSKRCNFVVCCVVLFGNRWLMLGSSRSLLAGFFGWSFLVLCHLHDAQLVCPTLLFSLTSFLTLCIALLY